MTERGAKGQRNGRGEARGTEYIPGTGSPAPRPRATPPKPAAARTDLPPADPYERQAWLRRMLDGGHAADAPAAQTPATPARPAHERFVDGPRTTAHPPVAEAPPERERSPGRVASRPVDLDAAELPAPPVLPVLPAPLAPAPPPADALLDAVERAERGARPFPLTLISGVAARPGALGPLFSYLGQRMRARRPWGGIDRLTSSAGLVASMRDAAEREDLDGALRYLHAILFPDRTGQPTDALILPLWNLDRTDVLGWNVFQALAAIVTLAARQQRRALYVVVAADGARARAMADAFDLTVPVAELAADAYDDGVAAALTAVAAGRAAPAERELRLKLPVARVQRRYDELLLDLRAPEPEAPRGLGASLLSRLKGGRGDEEQLAAFARHALLTVFRWDPFLQYVELALLREERGVRRAAVEIRAERGDYPAANDVLWQAAPDPGQPPPSLPDLNGDAESTARLLRRRVFDVR